MICWAWRARSGSSAAVPGTRSGGASVPAPRRSCQLPRSGGRAPGCDDIADGIPNGIADGIADGIAAESTADGTTAARFAADSTAASVGSAPSAPSPIIVDVAQLFVELGAAGSPPGTAGARDPSAALSMASRGRFLEAPPP